MVLRGSEQRLRGILRVKWSGSWLWCPVAAIVRVIEAIAAGFPSSNMGVACKCKIP